MKDESRPVAREGYHVVAHLDKGDTYEKTVSQHGNWATHKVRRGEYVIVHLPTGMGAASRQGRQSAVDLVKRLGEQAPDAGASWAWGKGPSDMTDPDAQQILLVVANDAMAQLDAARAKAARAARQPPPPRPTPPDPTPAVDESGRPVEDRRDPSDPLAGW